MNFPTKMIEVSNFSDAKSQQKKNLIFSVGSVPALNTIRRDRDKQSGQSASGGSAFENDPFSMKNSTKEFRTRCDKVRRKKTKENRRGFLRFRFSNEFSHKSFRSSAKNKLFV